MTRQAILRVARYSDQHQALWDEFVGRSKNGTFLFYRDYMDYHRDRFTDYSLIVCDEADHVVALLPANLAEDGTTLVSHSGLTYGGFITDAHMKTALMLRVFDSALTFCREQGLTGLRYKATPYIYSRLPAQEDLYALFLSGAQVAERNVITAVSQQERPAFERDRRYGLNKTRRYNLRVSRDEASLPTYWDMLVENLRERHQARPVHTLAEIQLLQTYFPNNIQLYACYEGEVLIAGVLIFESDCVARAQYTAANARAVDVRALDLVHNYLLNEIFVAKPYFDFGTSHDPTTGKLNVGLIERKESFGARAIAQDSYWLDLTSWTPERLREAIS